MPFYSVVAPNGLAVVSDYDKPEAPRSHVRPVQLERGNT
jgi:hypothetical protein